MADEPDATTPVTGNPTSTEGAPPGDPARGDPARGESIVSRLIHRGADEVDALLEALGMREQLSGEAQDIARLIERRLAQAAWGDHSHALDQLEIQRAFLTHRFIGPMKAYERSYRGYAYLDNFLNLVSILAGVGASLSAALDAPKVYAIVFGLIVGFLQSLSQWLKPSRRSIRQGLAGAELRSEAWAFLQKRARYRDKDDLAAWGLLCDQVTRVEDRETTEQDKEAATVPAGRRAK
jgi:hypothetical protein